MKTLSLCGALLTSLALSATLVLPTNTFARCITTGGVMICSEKESSAKKGNSTAKPQGSPSTNSAAPPMRHP